MAFCPKCGRQTSDDATFCPACGATIAAAAPGGTAAPPPQPPAPPAGISPPQPPGPPMGAQPPYAQQPVGAPPSHVPGVVPPPPVKKKMSSGWKIAIVIILVAILVIGAGVAIFGVLIFKAVKAPVDVTNRYIEAINDGDAQEAWDLLHTNSPFRQDYTQSSFASDVVQPSKNTLATWNANEVNVENNRANVRVDMEFTDGSDFRVTFELRKDGDDWKIYDYSSPDAL
jgi:uncharacterized protein YxeA